MSLIPLLLNTHAEQLMGTLSQITFGIFSLSPVGNRCEIWARAYMREEN